MHVLLVTNGPGELYTWVGPVLRELRQQVPTWRVAIGVIPCQFASGREAEIAQTLGHQLPDDHTDGYGADAVFSTTEVMQTITLGRPLQGFSEGVDDGLVLSLGGSGPLAVRLAKRLGWAVDRYHFEPFWHKQMRTLYVSDAKREQRAKRSGAPEESVINVGNLVADALTNLDATSITNTNKGEPHILVMAGSRDGFVRYILPMMLAVVDSLAENYPNARFVYPRSRLVSKEGFQAALSGDDLLGGVRGTLAEDGTAILTEAGTRLEIIDELDRYAHMKQADIALSIPGTNTLELGMAGVPSVITFPLNKPEDIPLEGIGHWLGLIPLIGKPLKRRAVLMAAPHLPASLPNHFSGEELMVELKGVVTATDVSEQAINLLEDDARRAHIRERLNATMPQPGAAKTLVDALIAQVSSDAVSEKTDTQITSPKLEQHA
ncbi:MAG: hypothetical protein AAF267_05450 [Deinococcota bacterium]